MLSTQLWCVLSSAAAPAPAYTREIPGKVSTAMVHTRAVPRSSRLRVFLWLVDSLIKLIHKHVECGTEIFSVSKPPPGLGYAEMERL